MTTSQVVNRMKNEIKNIISSCYIWQKFAAGGAAVFISLE
jgi:hypothetical protein